MSKWLPAGPVSTLPLPSVIRDGRLVASWVPIGESQASDEMPDLSGVPLVNAGEAATFAIPKRAHEHASGRFVLAKLLGQQGFEVSDLAITRDENRRPSLIYRDGKSGEALPEISIGHSNGCAIAALSLDGSWIGIDAEPLDLTRPRNLLPFMVSGEEFDYLNRLWDINEWTGMQETTRTWVVKEAVQKACGLGMSVAPQSFTVLGREDVFLNHQHNSYRLEVHHWSELLDGRSFTFGFSRLIERV